MIFTAEIEWVEEDEELKDIVLVVADTYEEAINKISNQFGDDNIAKITIKWINDSEVININDSMVAAIEELNTY